MFMYSTCACTHAYVHAHVRATLLGYSILAKTTFSGVHPFQSTLRTLAVYEVLLARRIRVGCRPLLAARSRCRPSVGFGWVGLGRRAGLRGPVGGVDSPHERVRREWLELLDAAVRGQGRPPETTLSRAYEGSLQTRAAPAGPCMYAIAPLLLVSSQAAPFPVLDASARVKQYKGRGGALMPDQEEMRKLIVSWAAFSEAKNYEVCQDCPIDEDGVRVNTLGIVRLIELDDTCNGKPCVVYQAMPRGRHTFHVRALIGVGSLSPYAPARYTRWSAPRIYNVQEPGTVYSSGPTTRDEL